MYDELKQKLGYMGAVNHKKVGVLDLYRIFQECRSLEDYRVGLQAMNTFYNFGVKLKHRELASRLLAVAMACRVESEAVDLIKLYGTWLEHPPDRALVYAVMGHFLDKGEFLAVRDIARAAREDWRFSVEAPLYVFAVEAMLHLPQGPLCEALELHADAAHMGVRLPAWLHARVLDESMRAFEVALEALGTDEDCQGAAPDAEGISPTSASHGRAGDGLLASDTPPEGALVHLQLACRVAGSLARDGHLHGGANASTLCSLAWIFWHLAAVPEPSRASLLASTDTSGAMTFLGGDWARALEAAVENFGCHWGFSASLPQGLFHTLEASSLPEAARLVRVARARFGRFYPDVERN